MKKSYATTDDANARPRSVESVKCLLPAMSTIVTLNVDSERSWLMAILWTQSGRRAVQSYYRNGTHYPGETATIVTQPQPFSLFRGPLAFGSSGSSFPRGLTVPLLRGPGGRSPLCEGSLARSSLSLSFSLSVFRTAHALSLS